jgi:FtsP/CotA-like multicopper oxidase with cupredoxin domain
MGQMMTWTINGRVFEMEGAADDEMVYCDETMAGNGSTTHPIPHPMHMHNVMFQVVGRAAPSTLDSYNTINQGLGRQRMEGYSTGLAG